MDHLVIPDTQIKPGVSLKHIDACGRLIRKRKPKRIIILADWWDFPSLNSYDKRIFKELNRLKKDIDCGNEAMDLLLSHIKYKADLIFTWGNHEERLNRLVGDFPELDGVIGPHLLNLTRMKVYPFLQPAELEGVHYAHYFANPFSGHPYGGTIKNMLDKIGFSFTQGHKQTLEWGRKDLANGKVIQGLIAGAFYQHNERYKGPQGNHHWRGVIYKHSVRSGKYDMETFSIQRLLREYGR